MSNLINSETLKARLDETRLRIVDVRFDLSSPEAGRKAYEDAHIPGALYLDLDKDLSGVPAEHGGRHPLPDMQVFARKLEHLGISNSDHVVVYDDSAGVFAGRLWWMLKYAGHDAVQLLDGGFAAWTEAGFEVSSETSSFDEGVFTLSLRPEMLVDKNYIFRNLDNPNVLLIDARGAERYRGEVEPLDPVGGHIPGALNRPYIENLQQGRYKTAKVLKEEFRELELDEAEELVLYCGSGVSANHNLIALEEAGIENAKLYVGSWSDWSSYKTNPVARGEELTE